LFSSIGISTTDYLVLQGSVETLFRWGGKHYIVANLFRILLTKIMRIVQVL